jgi:hypothetical protein
MELTEAFDVEFWAYPLQWGDTLSSHDWFPMFSKRFLASDFVAYACAENRRADIGTAVILWNAAFDQDPAGTLPDDDVALARLAGYGADIASWRAQREGVLYGWRPVHVDGEVRRNAPRLGHPTIAEICRDMFKRKRGREQGREAAQLAVRKSRLRKVMRSIGSARLAENDQVVESAARWLSESSLYCTEDNVRAALEVAAGIPKVVGRIVPSEMG